MARTIAIALATLGFAGAAFAQTSGGVGGVPAGTVGGTLDQTGPEGTPGTVTSPGDPASVGAETSGTAAQGTMTQQRTRVPMTADPGSVGVGPSGTAGQGTMVPQGTTGAGTAVQANGSTSDRTATGQTRKKEKAGTHRNKRDGSTSSSPQPQR